MSSNVLLYHFNNNSNLGESNSFVYDFSGNGNNGTSYGSSYPISLGRYNGAFEFEGGSGDYIDTGLDYSFSANGDFTVEAWIKAEDNNQVYAITQMRSAGYSSDWIFFYGSGNSLFWMRSQTLNKPLGFNASEWNHLAMVWNRTSETYEGFVNGQSIGVSGVVSDYGGIDTVKIGTRGDATSSFFQGEIDEVAIHTRALTQDEIENHYERGSLLLNISTRSCEEESCGGVDWIAEEINSSFVDLSVSSNRYFQYKINMKSEEITSTPKLFNTTINYGDPDSSGPYIDLISPSDDVGNDGGGVVFRYNVSDDNEVSNCELIVDGSVLRNDNSIEKGIEQQFALSYLVEDTYEWQINCTDSSDNEESSEIREITIVPSYEFNGTNLSEVDIENITNLVIEILGYGRINFTENINLNYKGSI
jgi:hypothetical protein